MKACGETTVCSYPNPNVQRKPQTLRPTVTLNLGTHGVQRKMHGHVKASPALHSKRGSWLLLLSLHRPKLG